MLCVYVYENLNNDLQHTYYLRTYRFIKNDSEY